MPVKTKYLLIVSIDIPADKEELFNEIYDTEHVPNLLKVPGILSATRLVSEPMDMMVAGRKETISVPEEPKFTAIYEITSPDVVLSPEWSKFAEAGRWPEHVRPYVVRHRRVLKKVLTASSAD